VNGAAGLCGKGGNCRPGCRQVQASGIDIFLFHPKKYSRRNSSVQYCFWSCFVCVEMCLETEAFPDAHAGSTPGAERMEDPHLDMRVRLKWLMLLIVQRGKYDGQQCTHRPERTIFTLVKLLAVVWTEPDYAGTGARTAAALAGGLLTV
jgi:hypothetical protein